MRRLVLLAVVLTLASLIGSARAQTGSLDQVSPNTGFSWFNADSVSVIWQCEVATGFAGQLEGVTISTASGAVGQTVDVRLRLGPGWNVNPAAFSATAVKLQVGPEDIFVDMSAANILLNVGDLYVIELQGTGTGTFLGGSHVPPPGSPLYPQFLYLNGPGCWADCGYRIAFQTWMQGSGTFSSLCFGDGTQALPCPCSNSGGAGRGCENSASTGGARLTGSGAASPDTVVLHASGELLTAPTIFMQGNANVSPLPFGDGLRCAGGLLKRLYVKNASNAAVNAPEPGNPTITLRSMQLGDPIVPGTSRWYQAYYRDTDATFCPTPTGNVFNFTNAIQVDW